MAKTLWLLVLGLVLAGPSRALKLGNNAELSPVGQIDLRGAYNNLNAATDSGALLGQALFLPALKLGDSDFILPVFYANIADDSAVIEEDTFFTRSVLILADPSYKHLFGDSWELKVRGDAKRSYNQEAKGEIMGQGFYDYEEFGGGLEGAYKFQLWEAKSRLVLGLDVLHRGYPNAHTVGIAATTDPSKNYYIKDYNGGKVSLEGKADWASFSLDLAYSLLRKDYTDFYSPQSDGTTDYSALRADNYHTLDLTLEGKATDNLKLGFQAGGILNQSNANWFDASGPLVGGANKYLPDFYGYRSLNFKPSARWYFAGDPAGHNLGLSYNLMLRDYFGRLIHNPNGDYAQAAQSDVEHDLVLDGYFALPWNFGIVGSVSQTWALSNQQETDVPLMANYRLFGANLGLQYKF